MTTAVGQYQQRRRRPLEVAPSQQSAASATLGTAVSEVIQYAASRGVAGDSTGASALQASLAVSGRLSSVLAGATVTLLLAQPAHVSARPSASATAATGRGGFVSVHMEAPSEEQLDALASAGADRLLPYVQPATAPAIRALAAHAARLSPDEHAARTLIRTLLRDASPLVREAAVLAAGYHADEEILGLLQTIAHDGSESPGVRMTAGDVLADLQQQ